MASPNIMNIPSPTNLADVNECNEKCSYSFNYLTSYTCKVQNVNGEYFKLNYDTNTTSVTFNSQEYVVRDVNIYFPSRHSFNNDNYIPDGEIVIRHVSGNKTLYICIPIDTTLDVESDLLNEILNEISNLQISKNDIQTLNLDEDYNLSYFVKYNKPFFYYNSNNETNNYIVYSFGNGYKISTNNKEILKSLLSNSTNVSPFSSVAELSYNKTGAVSNNSDDIYIDCQPVDEYGNISPAYSEDDDEPSFLPAAY
jgi:carbonic anhydrase